MLLRRRRLLERGSTSLSPASTLPDFALVDFARRLTGVLLVFSAFFAGSDLAFFGGFGLDAGSGLGRLKTYIVSVLSFGLYL